MAPWGREVLWEFRPEESVDVEVDGLCMSWVSGFDMTALWTGCVWGPIYSHVPISGFLTKAGSGVLQRAVYCVGLSRGCCGR